MHSQITQCMELLRRGRKKCKIEKRKIDRKKHSLSDNTKIVFSFPLLSSMLTMLAFESHKRRHNEMWSNNARFCNAVYNDVHYFDMIFNPIAYTTVCSVCTIIAQTFLILLCFAWFRSVFFSFLFTLFSIILFFFSFIFNSLHFILPTSSFLEHN